jgi:hypothetical protein
MQLIKAYTICILEHSHDNLNNKRMVSTIRFFYALKDHDIAYVKEL